MKTYVYNLCLPDGTFFMTAPQDSLRALRRVTKAIVIGVMKKGDERDSVVAKITKVIDDLYATDREIAKEAHELMMLNKRIKKYEAESVFPVGKNGKMPPATSWDCQKTWRARRMLEELGCGSADYFDLIDSENENESIG